MNRNLLEGTFNFRDLGGYTSHAGLNVKKHMIFRSDALSKLTEKDIQMLEHDLGIRTVIDLRQEHEILENPNVILQGVATVNLSPVAPLAELSTASAKSGADRIKRLIRAEQDEDLWAKVSQNGEAMADQMLQMAFDPYSLSVFKSIFEIILDTNQVPLVFHCKGGKDRTGLMSALFLMALGVSKDQIIQDYMLTKTYMQDRNIKRMNEYREMTDNQRVLDFLASVMDTKASYIGVVFDAIQSKYHSHLDYLMLDVGLTDDQISRLHGQYLENGFV